MEDKGCNDIDNIRKDAIAEIKEKVRKNPKFLHPANKERLEYQEKLKFTNGNDFTCWMQQVGIMKSHVDVDHKVHEKAIENAGCKTKKEYLDKCARAAGFKDYAEQKKEWRHETGRQIPKEDNPYCSAHFGDFTENLMIRTFEGAIRMPYGNPGYDWTCKRGDKIDNKGVCCGNRRYAFGIKYNDKTDWFILSAWDNRDSLTPLYVWAFHKNDIVKYRIGNGYILKKFCDRETFTIPDNPEGLKEFEKYEVSDRLDKLKELCNKREKKTT